MVSAYRKGGGGKEESSAIPLSPSNKPTFTISVTHVAKHIKPNVELLPPRKLIIWPKNIRRDNAHQFRFLAQRACVANSSASEGAGEKHTEALEEICWRTESRSIHESVSI